MAAAARKITCAAPSCKVRFTPKRSTAKYHAPACRVAAQRARDAAKTPVPKKAEPKTAPRRTEAKQTATKAADNHELVTALRQELETAQVLDTFEGQLALELARRLVTPGENASALADKVRAAKANALGVKPGGESAGAAGESEPEDDEVTRARRQREEARQAAGLA